jgi:serine phosphatase RsbU (regulator of sigma subunit)
MLIQGVRRGDPDARLLLIPVGFNALANWINDILLVLVTAGYSPARPILDFWRRTFRWPFPFGLYDVSVWMIVLAVLGIVVLRFARSRHEEDQMKSEREAARAVQQVLIPDAIPEISGFKIESVYKPASEVGGDFFQILPTADGGVLIVIGDVSGKGMPAAMTVSLLAGTVRTLAHYTQSPGEILTAMNQLMRGRSNGGFTTCLVLLAGPNGALIAANAGHLAPYLDGKELTLENGLPLGLAAEAHYVESSFQLPPFAPLTLITDGIVEARDASGELFGFERTLAISSDNAEAIAQAAMDFGQDDDITVLSVKRTPAMKEATA